jgi:hypothetical protein
MRYLIGFAFLLSTIALAKEPSIPKALLNAKTAFVYNDGAKAKDFDKFCEALKKWKRFSFVQDRRSADIIIELHPLRWTGRAGKFEVNRIRIFNALNTLLWEDQTDYQWPNASKLISNLKIKMKGH